MTDLYSGLGGGPAPETRRAEGRPPPSPPSWTGPVQLPWSRRQPPPGLPLSPESPTRSSRTIPGPLPLSTTQPHFRLSRPLIAIAPGLGARGKGKKKKGGWRALASVSPLLACRDTLRSGGASSCGESVRLDWAGPLPLFPQRRRPPSRSATPPPVATRRALALPWPRAQACLQLGRAGGEPPLSSRVPIPAWQRAGPGCEVPALLRVWPVLERWARSAGRGRGFQLWVWGAQLQSCPPRELPLGAWPLCTRKLQFVGVLIGGSLFGRDDLVEEKSPRPEIAAPVVSWSLSQSFHLVLTALAVKSPRCPIPLALF